MNLAEWLRRSPRPAAQEQLAVVAALAQAVEDGHRAGTQYAGWSPSKIAIRGESLDLSALDAGKHPVEDYAYSAPEVAEAGARSKRSDVYSAGVILYEILAGAHPFGGMSVQQQRGAARPLSELRRDLSQDLADAVTACLDWDPEWRPPDLSYILQVARGLCAKSTASPRPDAGLSFGARPDAGLSFGARPPSPPSRMPLVIAGVVIAITAGAAAFWALRRPPSSTGSGRSASAPADANPAPDSNVHTPPAATPASPAGVASPETAATPGAAAIPQEQQATPVSTTLPNAAGSKPLAPSPAPGATPPPAVMPTVRPTITPTATPFPASTLAASTSAPTMPPVQTPAPTVIPSKTPESVLLLEPVTLKSLTPLKLRRGLKGLLDVRGDNLRAEDQVTISKLKGRGDPSDVLALRKRLVDPTLLQVLVNVAPNAPTGLYALVVVDAQGRASNALTLEVTQ